MTEPASREEFERLFQEQSVIAGFGVDVAMSQPCPFCAAPGFIDMHVLEVKETLTSRDFTCTGCGLAVRFLVTENGANVVIEMVQVGGPPPPAWMEAPPRRLEDA